MDIETTDAWLAYCELRKAKNRIAPFTPLAKARILSKLRMLAADGQDPLEILWTSVENGWTGIFEIKRKGWQPPARAAESVKTSKAYLDEQRAHAAEVERQRRARMEQRA